MAQPQRAYDALYDSTFTVSGAKDHYRQQSGASNFTFERAPHYPNMFSVLPHHPDSSFRIKDSDKVPAFLDREYHPYFKTKKELAMVSGPNQVSGKDRYMYFKRPLLSAPESLPFKAALPPLAPPPPPPAPPEPAIKTIGTQSDYRETEAQTTPWDPDYVLPMVMSAKQRALCEKYNCEGPELLHLKDMKFAEGLPPGLQEIIRVDKMRAKRAFEATLPPIDDIEQLPLRQKMIEEWEEKEWKERDQEILSVQEERLALIDHALQVREEEIEQENARRVEDRRTKMLQDKATKFASIQANRIKTMRQLIEARKYVEKPRKLHKQTIVERYADFASTAYAPVQRDGRFPETKPRGAEIETEGFQPATLQAVVELETFVPSHLLNPKVSAPKRPTKLDYGQRKEAAVQKDLKTINDLLDNAKGTKGRGYGDCWPAPLQEKVDGKTVRKSAAHIFDRPETPSLPPPASTVTAKEGAIVLLQRLLRGRAIQNVMYEGKMRRLELIQELRLGEVPPTGAYERPELVSDAAIKVDGIIGAAVAELCSLLTEADDTKRESLLERMNSRPKRPLPSSRSRKASSRKAESAMKLPEDDVAAAGEETSAVEEAPDGGDERTEADAAAAANSFKELGITPEEAEHAAVKIQDPADPAEERNAMKEAEDEQMGKGVVEMDFSDLTEADQARIVKLQAASRGYLARKKVKAMKQEKDGAGAVDLAGPAGDEVAEGEGADEQGDEPQASTPDGVEMDYSNLTEEDHARIVKLQAASRGYIARKRVRAMKENEVLKQSNLSLGGTVVPMAAEVDMEEVATGSGAQMPVDDAELFEKKISKIQAAARGRAARKKVAAMKRAKAEMVKMQEEIPDLEQKVIKIQAVARGRMGRKRAAQIKAEKGEGKEVQKEAAEEPSAEGVGIEEQEAKEGEQGNQEDEESHLEEQTAVVPESEGARAEEAHAEEDE